MNMRFVQKEEKGIKRMGVDNNEYEICADGGKGNKKRESEQ